MYLSGYVWHQRQVLQVGVEQRGASEADPKQSLHYVTDRAVIRQTDALSRGHEGPIASLEKSNDRRSRFHAVIDEDEIVGYFFKVTNKVIYLKKKRNPKVKTLI